MQARTSASRAPRVDAARRPWVVIVATRPRTVRGSARRLGRHQRASMSRRPGRGAESSSLVAARTPPVPRTSPIPREVEATSAPSWSRGARARPACRGSRPGAGPARPTGTWAQPTMFSMFPRAASGGTGRPPGEGAHPQRRAPRLGRARTRGPRAPLRAAPGACSGTGAGSRPGCTGRSSIARGAILACLTIR